MTIFRKEEETQDYICLARRQACNTRSYYKPHGVTITMLPTGDAVQLFLPTLHSPVSDIGVQLLLLTDYPV